MTEYIERQKALDTVFRSHSVEGAHRFLAAIPAADVRSVVHGKWLRTPTYWAYCSVCGEEPPDETNTTTNFCPNCGADMREGET